MTTKNEKTPTAREVAKVIGGIALMFVRSPVKTAKGLARELLHEFAPKRGSR